jgi:transposase
MAKEMDPQDQLSAEITLLRAALAAKSAELETAQSTIADQATAITELTQKYQEAQDKYEKLRRMHFGSTSEKQTAKDDDQPNLFDEAEAFTDGMAEETQSEAEPETAAATKTKKKPGRKPIPAHLERQEVIHDLTDAEKTCPCCGKARPAMGEDRSEEVDIIPAKAVVKVHVRKKYGECDCQGFLDSGLPAVVKAPGPVKIIPGGLFTNETIALILSAKYADAIPLARSVKIFARAGLETSRGTLCNQVLQIGRRIGPLLDLMWTDARASPVIRMDETRVQVLKEADKTPQSQSYMWVTYAYRDRRPILLFRYHPGREGAMAWKLLEEFSGFLQTDGYAGYKAIGEREGIIHVACWAHIRREFKSAFDLPDCDKPLIQQMIDLIARLYRIESELRERLTTEDATKCLTENEFMAERKRRAGAQMARIELWLDEQAMAVAPKSPLGKAIAYAKGQFSRATKYVDHFLLTPDNNPVENAIRPFVVGRKGWMFCDTPRGAHASAGIYSLVETAKANGLEPYAYLCRLMNELPLASDEAALRRLLPYAVD